MCFKYKYPPKDFSKLDNIPQMGDVILYRNNKPDFISRGIEFFSDGRVSHVDIYVGGGDGTVIGYSADGCTIRKLSDYFKPYHTIIVRRIKGITVDQAAKMKDAAYKDADEHQPYDFLSYVGFIIMWIGRKLGILKRDADNPIQSRGKVCSTAYDAWAIRAGLDLFSNIGNESVMPQTILESDKFDTLIEI